MLCGKWEGNFKKGLGEDICICIADSLCSTVETNKTLQINYIPTEIKKKKKVLSMRGPSRVHSTGLPYFILLHKIRSQNQQRQQDPAAFQNCNSTADTLNQNLHSNKITRRFSCLGSMALELAMVSSGPPHLCDYMNASVLKLMVRQRDTRELSRNAFRLVSDDHHCVCA